MTTYNKQTLKTFFEQGDKPQGSDYANLIDSQVNIVETSVQSMGGALATTELITPRVSAANANFTGIVSANQFQGTINVGNVNQSGNLFVAALGGIRINASSYSGTNTNLVIQDVTDAIILKATGTGSTSMDIQNDVGSLTLLYGQGTDGLNGDIQCNGQLFITTTSGLAVRNGIGFPPIFAIDSVFSTVQPSNNLRQPVAIISAAGTAQATATLCSAAICRLQGVTDGSTTGFSIPANKTGWVQYILNETAVSANLWPPTGGTINNGTANTAFALAAKTSYTIFHIAASAYGVK